MVKCRDQLFFTMIHGVEKVGNFGQKASSSPYKHFLQRDTQCVSTKLPTGHALLEGSIVCLSSLINLPRANSRLQYSRIVALRLSPASLGLLSIGFLFTIQHWRVVNGRIMSQRSLFSSSLWDFQRGYGPVLMCCFCVLYKLVLCQFSVTGLFVCIITASRTRAAFFVC